MGSWLGALRGRSGSCQSGLDPLVAELLPGLQLRLCRGLARLWGAHAQPLAFKRACSRPVVLQKGGLSELDEQDLTCMACPGQPWAIP